MAISQHLEGAATEVLSTRYERNPLARSACLEHWGYDCQCCGMSFQKRYGEIGKDFIHVHHRKPISEISGTYTVDPINDLIPVCPNCHAMIHTANPPYSVEEVREMLAQRPASIEIDLARPQSP